MARGSKLSQQELYNATCPFCGQDELRTNVTTTDSNVPLWPHGYDTSEGDPESSDITCIICAHCQAEVDPVHYFLHGKEGGVEGETCYCKEAAQ